MRTFGTLGTIDRRPARNRERRALVVDCRVRQIDESEGIGRTDVIGQERYTGRPTIGATAASRGLDIATAGSGTPLQGGSGWSISDALYVTNRRTRRSLMPVRGPWCGRSRERERERARVRVGY